MEAEPAREQGRVLGMSGMQSICLGQRGPWWLCSISGAHREQRHPAPQGRTVLPAGNVQRGCASLSPRLAAAVPHSGDALSLT